MGDIQVTQFDRYSLYYDLFYGEKPYDAEASYVTGLINGEGKSLRILELGCGTGGHAVQLAAAGHHVTGIDVSTQMIDRARARRSSMPALADRLRFEHGDIREWRSDERFDAVISLFHVMSYQATNTDLKATFATASHHLETGGLFAFDYWFGPGVLSIGPSVMVRRASSNRVRFTRIAQPHHHPNQNCVDVAIEVLIDDDSGAFDRINEVHRMRYLFAPELDFLASDHFLSSGHFGWLRRDEPRLDDWTAVSVFTKR